MKLGREQLKDWIHRRVFTQREAAAHLRCHETFLSQILSGVRQPGLDTAIQIERLTGIPVEAWLTEGAKSVVAASAGNRKRTA